MATFSTSTPLTTYWTPPTVAKGWDKAMLGLTGYKEDGTQNTFGKIGSWIPGFNLAQNAAAQNTARNAGLTDVANTIADDFDNRLGKLKTVGGVALGVAGGVTGNPALIQRGLSMSASGVTGLAADPGQTPMAGQSYLQAFAGGGVYGPGKGATMAADRTAVARPMLAGQTTGGLGKAVNSVTKPADEFTQMSQEMVARDGTDYVRNWVRQSAAMGRAGLRPGDAVYAGLLNTPTVMNTNAAYNSVSAGNDSGGQYDPMTKEAILRPNADPLVIQSAATHEVTHQWQDMMGDRSLSGPGQRSVTNPAWAASESLIRQSVAGSSKASKDPYLTQPIEVHSRIMEMRQAADLKPGQVVTPELYQKVKRSAEQYAPNAVGGLNRVLDEKQIIDLMNKTVSNDQPQTDPTLFAAAEGGVYQPPGGTRLPTRDELIRMGVSPQQADQYLAARINQSASPPAHRSATRPSSTPPPATTSAPPRRTNPMPLMDLPDNVARTDTDQTATSRPVSLFKRPNEGYQTPQTFSKGEPERLYQKNAQKGTDYVRNWIRQSAAMGRAGLRPEDAVAASRIANPVIVKSKEEFDRIYEGNTADVGAFYQSKVDSSFIPSTQGFAADTHAAHEATHQWQRAMGDQTITRLGAGQAITPGWAASEALIRQAVHSSSKASKDDYLTKPVEVHARIMQLRRAGNLKPGQVVTPSLYRQLVNKVVPRLNEELNQVLDEKQIIDLMNKTVSNDMPQDQTTFAAYKGGALPGIGGPVAGQVRQYSPGSRQEDQLIVDQTTGQVNGLMRAGELIFDQKAKQTIDRLIDGGTAAELGNFIKKERATHPDQTQAFWEGGVSEDPAYWTRMLNPISPINMAKPIVPQRPSTPFTPTIKPIDQAQKAIGSLSTQATGSAGASAPSAKMGVGDWASIGMDALGAIGSAIGANRKLPTQTVTPAWQSYLNEVSARADQGLLPSERAAAERAIGSGYDRQVQSIADVVGGGGSGAAVLSALGTAGRNTLDAGLNLELAAADRRRQNLGVYGQAVGQQMAQDNQNYSLAYNNAVNSRDAFTKSMVANLQQIGNRFSYNQTYGPGSAFQTLQAEMAKMGQGYQQSANAPFAGFSAPIGINTSFGKK
ncbi:hypothetical protein [Spirosoma sordidisoli]|uniref:Uncharacterized protein n=1 Tax=Spirosoma sordidisoli TaxID=2502893 RepID=A0A4Q2US12_9BACT|nr:hypothetical protein [Spirosoma sordidisoli]RYC69619.1 hypothetical protein EQG79_13530 [Spirosoma sordidisoli]